ncbi:MAG: competence/damage-inducible protein A [Phycisphaerales bacterium]|nr:competence/damage-inducible protein A [Phycisphaerales bacterium]
MKRALQHARVAILSVGDELVLAQIEDTNAPFLARRLLEIGAMPGERRTVGDDQHAIAHAMLDLARTHVAVIVTGGLGPTLDDLTREALAEAIAIASGDSTERALLVEDPAGIAHLKMWFEDMGRVMPLINRKQALRPHASRLLANPLGTAPGVATLASAPISVYCLPGPPREMQPMFDAEVAPHLASTTHLIATRALHTVGRGESALAELLGDLMDRTRTPSVGTTARGGIVSIRIRAEGSAASARAALDATTAVCRERVGSLIFGFDDETLASSVGAMLLAQSRTLATAESCTGGLVSALLTDIAGSSAWYLGGFVVYANARKIEDVGVPSEMIARYGAVSHETAIALARGALHRMGSDYAISTTGIAGPSGGTPEKPVGCVFIAIADRCSQQVFSRRFLFVGARQAIRERAAVMALASLRAALLSDPCQSLLWAESELVRVEAI